MAKIPPQQTSTAPAWAGSIRFIFLAGLVIVLVGIVSISTAALPLTATGLLLAYILYPVKSFLQRRVFRGRGGPAVTVVILLVISTVLLILLLVVPTLIIQTVNFIESTFIALNEFATQPLVFNGEPVLNESGEAVILLDELNELVRSYVGPALDGTPTTGDETTTPVQPLPIDEGLIQTILVLTGDFVSISFQLFGSIAAAGINGLFLILMLSYFLSDGQTMIESIIEVAPDGYERDLRRIFWEFGQVWNDYLRGQLILGLLMGFLMWLMSIVLGLQNPVFLGVFAGFMEFIPNLGPVLAMLPPVLVALFSGSSNFPEMNTLVLVGIIVAIWIVVQQLEGLVFQPRIMGSSLNLHPVVIVIGVIVGGSLAGIVGVILSSPLIATGRILLQYVYGRLAEEPPFRRNPSFEHWLQIQ
ncbi:MAG: AI-2E family transporter, partial [Chloroflexota bacterium]